MKRPDRPSRRSERFGRPESPSSAANAIVIGIGLLGMAALVLVVVRSRESPRPPATEDSPAPSAPVAPPPGPPPTLELVGPRELPAGTGAAHLSVRSSRPLASLRVNGRERIVGAPEAGPWPVDLPVDEDAEVALEVVGKDEAGREARASGKVKRAHAAAPAPRPEVVTPGELPRAKRWALGCDVASRALGRNDKLLGGLPKDAGSERQCKELLGRLGLDDRKELLDSLERLHGEDVHDHFYRSAASMVARDRAWAKRVVEGKENATDELRLQIEFALAHEEEIGDRGLVAWDQGRAVSRASWGYLAGYLSEEEAWAWNLRAAARIQRVYTSWEEYVHHYLLAIGFTTRNTVSDAELHAIDAARHDPDGGWRLDWSTDLGQKVRAPSDLRQAERWTLGCGLVTQINGARMNVLGGEVRTSRNVRAWRESLGKWWGCGSREDLLETLASLRDGAVHDAAYRELARRVAQDRAWARDVASGKVAADPHVAFVLAHEKELGEKGLVAWDQGRLVNVAGWGYLVGWLSEDEAWSWSMPAAARIQKVYSSWAEFGRHFVLGRQFWGGDSSSAEKAPRACAELLGDPRSPWSLDWATDLGPVSRGAR